MGAALAHALRLLENGQAHDARYVCSQILAQMPQHPGALQCMGQALSALGQHAEALQAYGVALARQPSNVHLHTGQGAALLRLGHPREALECLIRACALAPPDAPTRALATQAAQLAILSFFDPASPYLEHVRGDKALHIRTALHALNDGYYERASAELSALLTLWPDDIDGHILSAATAYRRNKFEAAASHLAQAASGAPTYAQRAILFDYQSKTLASLALQALRGKLFDIQHDHVPPGTAQPVHLYSSFADHAGTELRTLSLAKRLQPHTPVQIWSTSADIHPAFASEKIYILDPARGTVPRGGTLVIVGPWHAIGDWYRQCRFRRVVVVHNVDEPHCLLVLLQALALPSQPKIELVFASEWMHQQLGLPGHFEPSPIDTTVFAPATAERRDHAFVVGRLSRDTALKYHPGAPAFFTRLADAGMHVRLMGATVLAPALPPHNRIELLAAGAVAAPAFLQSLDCFTYRTHTCFPEAWGRVVMEAMAVGLPVVVHATGGYAQVIDHGRNGFLFHSDDEAFALLSELQRSSALRRQIGNAARETVQALYGEAAFDRSYGFYLG